jgi:hypothetical protein
MTLDANGVQTSVSGEVLVGLTSATYPTSATAAATGFTGLGYLGPDGVVPKSEKSTNDLTAFQDNTVVLTVSTDGKRTIEFTLWETNVATIEFAYSTTVTQTETHGSYEIDPGVIGPRRKFIVEITSQDGESRREMFEGALTGMEEAGWKNGEPVAFKCTVTAYTKPQVLDTKLKSEV